MQLITNQSNLWFVCFFGGIQRRQQMTDSRMFVFTFLQVFWRGVVTTEASDVLVTKPNENIQLFTKYVNSYEWNREIVSEWRLINIGVTSRVLIVKK